MTDLTNSGAERLAISNRAVSLSCDPPICGVELEPYIVLRRADGTHTTDDFTASAPSDDNAFLKHRWFRSLNSRKVAFCSVHTTERATMQCVAFPKLTGTRTYHCSPECFARAWKTHRSNYDRIIGANGDSDAMIPGDFDNPTSASKPHLAKGPPAVTVQDASGERWTEVGQSRTYVPTSEDVGNVLKYEVTVVDGATGEPLPDASGSTNATLVTTSRTIPAPTPRPRHLLNVPVEHPYIAQLLEQRSMGGVAADEANSAGRFFTILTYNVLAELYATNDMYPDTPAWCLSWGYRRRNLLREISKYGADIVCLQEVQSDHYEDFWNKEMTNIGYDSVYKRKTTEIFTGAGSGFAIDGCATFYRSSKFRLVKKYEVEFNKAALSLSDMLGSAHSKKSALSRLLKDNVALIVVLEANDDAVTGGPDGDRMGGVGGGAGGGLGGIGVGSGGGEEKAGGNSRRLLCVANAHIHANPEARDVKLWQVHTLLKGLEKIAASTEIPMLVAGDFNSVPGSAPHSLLAAGRVHASHPDLAADPLGILQPSSKLVHHLPLASAYASLSAVLEHHENREAALAAGYPTPHERAYATPNHPLGSDNLSEDEEPIELNPSEAVNVIRRNFDVQAREPRFTNRTRQFEGTLDYIFFTADSLVPVSLLELPGELGTNGDARLPSPNMSSDHVAIMAEFAQI